MAETSQVIPHPWPEARERVKPLSLAEREALAESIQRDRVYIPILVLPDGRIIDGYHRWEISGGKVPFEICDVSEERALELVCDLNEIRRQYSPEELAEQREQRKQRALALRQEGKTQEEVAQVVGVARTTVEKWEGRNNDTRVNVSPRDLRVSIPHEVRSQVVKRVKKESTAQVAADLHVGVRRVQQIVQQEKTRKRKPKPVPSGTYNVIYADPPWPYDTQIKAWGPTSLHYPTMPLEDINKLPSAIHLSIAPNAILFLWTTNPFLKGALSVVEAWGFEYKSNLAWVKTQLRRPGTGFYVRGRHELLLSATRGSFTPLDKKISPPIGSVIFAPVQDHSRKPLEVYDLIERLYPKCNYVELFARSSRQGWSAWGDEAQ